MEFCSFLRLPYEWAEIAYLFTAESQRAESGFYFPFAAETPANENQDASGKLYIIFPARKG
jgi:hypothetical protein